MTTSPRRFRLIGPASVDRYVDESLELPGGGALNMAVHWRAAGHRVELLTRLASSSRPLFEPFLERHGVDLGPNAVVDGDPCTIDVRFADDRQPMMDGFVEGVLGDFRLTAAERSRLDDDVPTHVVLVDVADAMLHEAASHGAAERSAPWTGDFLSFRHMTPERFSATMRLLDLGIVGWPGSPDDEMVAELADRALDADATLVVTFGARGVLVVDGHSASDTHRWFEVDERQVTGSTVGCGDAFAAAFLASWFSDRQIGPAVAAGAALGATATEWLRPLPDDAYGDLLM